jgi:hypothetical protein
MTARIQHFLTQRNKLCESPITQKQKSSIDFVPDFVFDAFDVAAAESFDLAAQFEISLDLSIVQNTEAVDNGRVPTDHVQDQIRVQIEIFLMANSNDNRISTL